MEDYDGERGSDQVNEKRKVKDKLHEFIERMNQFQAELVLAFIETLFDV